jgi:L-aspartate oxidase
MTDAPPVSSSESEPIPTRPLDAGFRGPRFIAVAPEECTSISGCDVVVVGGGVAGATAALEAARQGASVVLVSKNELEESNTRYAQGGVAVVLGDGDSFDAHVRDTLSVGGGLCHEDMVRTIVEDGPRVMEQLVQWGGNFDRNAGGAIALSLEGGHSHGRVAHARGDATGLEIQTVVAARLRAERNIRVLEHTFAVDLVTVGGVVAGIIVASSERRFQLLRCRAVVLAAGGAGQIYRETTNPRVATGDGVAMAFRAGARLRGVEFFQFHPTTLYVPGVPRLLISETVRGEGGILRDRDGVAFMKEAHPQAELAGRDVVSRAIVRRIIATGDTCVYLDVTHIGEKRFRERFPGITRVLDTYAIDFTRQPIPVHPAAHYMIGGVVADLDGRTSVPGLYAIGEVASTGLHGANRLGSNSLLEGMVCGHRSGSAAAAEPGPTLSGGYDEGDLPPDREPRDLDRRDLWSSLRSVMWKRVSIERDAAGLAYARESLERWSTLLFRIRFEDAYGFELINAMTLSRLVATAAQARLESRGTHYRADYPERDDAGWRVDLELMRGV